MRPCKSCRRPIYLLETGDGKWMPVDADPALDGNLRINLTDSTVQTLTGDDLALARMDGVPLHISHFATCPYASKHRRRR